LLTYALPGLTDTVFVKLRVFAIASTLLASLTAAIAAELPGPLDFSGQVAVLSRMMGGETGRYRATVIDDFEGERIWKPHAAGAQLDEVQFLKMRPDHPAFEEEGGLCRVSGDEKSLFLHFAFQNPGKEHFTIRPASPIRLAAQPVRISFWLHSNRYLHTMSLLLKNADGLEIRVPAGRLDFRGWRRIELDLPVQMHERGRRLERRYSSQFLGIAIESNPHEPAGQAAISIDQMILLSDYADFRYPGADIQDTWTNEVPND
jgi:hypothetical protein